LHSGAGIGAGVGNTLAATGAGAGAGALIGAGIGTIVPVIGNAVGAAVGAVVGGIAGLITGIVGSATAGASVDPEQQALEKLARVYEKEGNARFADDESFKAMLSEQGITDPLLIQSLTENRQSTMELVAKMAENTAAISSMNEQMVA
jgi:phage tail tape-measure protein